MFKMPWALLEKSYLMSKSDEDYILMVLRQKSADDCVLTPISENVWACKEFKSGKIFMVRR